MTAPSRGPKRPTGSSPSTSTITCIPVRRRLVSNAVLANLALARASRIAPVSTSDFAGIAQGFYAARLYDLGDRRWRVENRGNLQTIRFDKAAFSAVDFKRSRGVLGQNHHQGSLYVALDPTETVPVIALHDVQDPGSERAPGSLMSSTADG